VYPASPLVLKNGLEGPEIDRYEEVEVGGEIKRYKKGYTIDEYTPWMKKIGLKSPILGNFASTYINRADVRKAMHIGDQAPAWEMCKDQSNYHSQEEASKWIYEVMRNRYKILFFSGDTDGALPTYGTRRWIESLNWPVLEKWRPWTINGQVAGYVEKYDGIDFSTVHGVGHMSPQWKREEVTTMVMAWLHDEEF